ncbi:MAG: glutamine synthetase III [Clostridiales bacterium]|nr:glutamine synthetase III [Candidatus Crickella caballi]
MSDIAKYYGCDVFDSRAMKSVLSTEVYNKLDQTIHEGRQLDSSIAGEVAIAMKNWAVSKGATHYTHWFQPMTGITAEKHDSFINPCGDGGVIMDFSGKELIQGEPDASSFPSGGLRATFEARGYTAWDPTSFAFIKGKTLCIPTAFCAYSGDALDNKTPLLRSMEALNTQAVRVLRLFGNETVNRVTPMTGAEQEYFLIDKAPYEKRRDLIFTGRTLFGAKPPKGQELDDHYFGAINPRIQAFMEDLDETLWRLGIPAKTEHNEVAPSQYELASVYESCNIATDHNQLIMELMQNIALNHGLVCILHEKPFDYVNGSGKHNNWSMQTDAGSNLLSPGKTPSENAQFLLFLTAVIKAVDDYQDLLRLSVATAGNDHRLGASEAPPAIISIFLGDELSAILKAIENNSPYVGSKRKLIKLGVDMIPDFPRDSTDRNRTSPIAFSGNKFEFRMVGSADSIASANIILNSAVADTLREFADKLEDSKNFEKDMHQLIRSTIKEHKRILFNGNGYDDEWVKEATEERGLLNLRTAADCIPYLVHSKNVEMLERMNVFSEKELASRCEIKLDNYCKCLLIEASTMLDMVRRDILPSVCTMMDEFSNTVNNKKKAVPSASCRYESTMIEKLSGMCDEIYDRTEYLESILDKADLSDTFRCSEVIRDELIPAMEKLRKVCDETEELCPKRLLPFPVYEELLFSVY